MKPTIRQVKAELDNLTHALGYKDEMSNEQALSTSINHYALTILCKIADGDFTIFNTQEPILLFTPLWKEQTK